MRIRKRLNPFSPAPHVVSSTINVSTSVSSQDTGSESCSITGTSCGSCCLFSDEKRKEETEKNRCSRQNGTGWRCANQSENGHSLCYHHLNLSRQWKRHQHLPKRHLGDGDGYDDDGSTNFHKFEVTAGKKKPRMVLLTSILDRTLPNPTP